jgi:hypothetical protein
MNETISGVATSCALREKMQDYELSVERTLPYGWQQPVIVSYGAQLSLFPSTPGDLGVTMEEYRRWRERLWLSSDYNEKLGLTADQQSELEFLRWIARSGLDSARIDDMPLGSEILKGRLMM